MITSGIYIHIPFCGSKCIYCDFYSVADQNEKIDQFIDATVKEIKTCQVDTRTWTFDTVFIGGGTPSLLSTEQIAKIINALNDQYSLGNLKEFTIEANPGEVSEDKLQDFCSLGINRLSIGVQSFIPALLRFLSRIHSTRDILMTYESARKAGFENINCDLIYNIPGQSLKNWQADLEQLVAINPDHISVYSLTVELNTKLHDLVLNETVQMPEDEKHLEFNQVAFELLNKYNYLQYEISNYAKSGKSCLHNLHYWENDTYLGFGPAAHSFNGKKRWNNIADLDHYISLSQNGLSPVEKIDRLTEIERINEIVGFGLRLTKGVDLSIIPTQLTNQFQNQLKLTKTKFTDMIIESNSRIRLNQKGMQFADAIAVELML